MKGISFSYLLGLLFSTVCLILFSNTYGEDKKTDEGKIAAQQGADSLKAQTVCPVAEGEIIKDAYIDYKGHRIYFCCMGCQAGFKKNPEKYLLILKEKEEQPDLTADVSEQKFCPVTGKNIDKSFYEDYDFKRVYLCSEKCMKKFRKNPEKYLEKM